jgi:hypothetical protein
LLVVGAAAPNKKEEQQKMTMEFDKIEALRADFQYVDIDNARTVLTVGFKASFYFWSGHTASKRTALVECFEAFEAAFGASLAWAFDADKGRRVKLSEKKLPQIREYADTLDEDDCFEWYVSSGEDDEAVGDFSASCLTERGWMAGDCSAFRFQVPRSLVFEPEGLQRIMNLLLLCHEKLAPFHGNAGLAAISTRDEWHWEIEKFEVATRYVALYIDSRVIDNIQAPRGIKSVNWLTFISNTLAEKLGGPQSFVRYCQKFDVDASAHAGGFLIRAGDLPQIGPVEEPAPLPYTKVNAALRPLRDGNFASMGSGSANGEVRFDRCISDLWIRRLDVPGAWPPRTLAGLPRTALGAAPSDRVTLQSGETCKIHGRYRDASFEPDEEEYDDAPKVVLLPGDFVPYKLSLGPHGEFLGREAVAWQLVAEL